MDEEIRLPDGGTADIPAGAQTVDVKSEYKRFRVIRATYRFPVTQVVKSPASSEGIVVAEVLADPETGARPQAYPGQSVRIVRPTALDVGSSGKHMVDVTRCHGAVETVGDNFEWVTVVPTPSVGSVSEMVKVLQHRGVEDAYKEEEEEEEAAGPLVKTGDVVMLTIVGVDEAEEEGEDDDADDDEA